MVNEEKMKCEKLTHGYVADVDDDKYMSNDNDSHVPYVQVS